MASIQKLNNKKGVSYRVHIRSRELPVISKTFPSKVQARQFVAELEGSRQKHLEFGSRNNKLSFTQLVEEYLMNEYLGTKPQQQRSRLNHWLKHLGKMTAADIIRADIASGLDKLPKELSNATINKYKKVVSVVFTHGIREHGLIDNPTRYIRALPENKGRTRFLSDNERERLFKACRASKWNKLYLLVLIAITTGARRGELLRLCWTDIDFERQTAYVITSKNGESKVLPLTNSVIEELKKFNHNDKSLIFCSEIKPDKPYIFFKQWNRVRDEAELIDFRFHDLRHTTASYLAQNGATLLEIADVLGHKQIEVTMRYSHLCIKHKSSLINRVMSSI